MKNNNWKTGRIKFADTNKKFGFIYIDGESDEIHFSFGNVIGKKPTDNDKVKFQIGQGQNDKPTAVNVTVISLDKFFEDNVMNLESVNYDDFCDKAKEYARELDSKGLSTSQIRKVYSLIMHSKDVREAKMLRPQFAYAAGRSKEPGVRNLMDLLDVLVKKIKSEEQLNNVRTFLETIVAYLKYINPNN